MTQMPMPLSWASASSKPSHQLAHLLSGTSRPAPSSPHQGFFTGNAAASSPTNSPTLPRATLTPPLDTIAALKRERKADQIAAGWLLTPDAVATALAVSPDSLSAAAAELEVTDRILEAWLRAQK